MPRQPRLDIPGLLQHVIVRGIERRPIFRDNGDRHNFIERFCGLLVKTNTDCLAWALLDNHFHLLLKPKGCDLKHFMRRLLTGYAVYFNKRHWCGEGVLLGDSKMKAQNSSEVLALFSDHPSAARKLYWQFVADGVGQVKRSELVGGGLKRSCVQQSPDDETQAYDERILGSADFVETLRQDEQLRGKIKTRVDLMSLAKQVSAHFVLMPDQIFGHSCDQIRRNARGLFCYIAVRRLEYMGTQVGKILNLQRAAVSQAVKRGELIAPQEPEAVDAILAAD